jgi:hypothetical protein
LVPRARPEAAVTSADGASGAYAYKPSLLGSPWTFRLLPDALEWEIGSRTGRIAYADIRRVRLSYRPAALQSARYLTEIWADRHPKLTIASASWRGILELETRPAEYSAFIEALHQRLADAGSRAIFVAGTPPLIYWLGTVVFVVVGLGLAALTVYAVTVAPWPAMLIVAGFFILFLWQIGPYFRRNRPAAYSPDRLPALLLPRG